MTVGKVVVADDDGGEEVVGRTVGDRRGRTDGRADFRRRARWMLLSMRMTRSNN